MKYLKAFLLVSVSLVLLLSFMSPEITKNNGILSMERMEQDTLKWVAPDSANSLINPYEANDENIAQGLLIYKKDCRSCHGKLGDGQGVEAEDLETVTSDFTNPSFVEQTDGSMFWKISEGRDDMESFKARHNEEAIWLVILYIKSFSVVSTE